MRTLLVAALVLPLAAFAQGAGPGGQGQGQGRGMGPGRPDPERMERRMRLARTLGLAEALDLDAPQALRLGEAIGKFDERRLAAHRQLRDAHQTLRKAAAGEKATPADVDQAIQRALEARAQLAAIDREVLATVTKDLSPDRKARAVLFLERFHDRFGPGPGPKGMGGRGHGRGGRMGPGNGFGPGHGGAMGMGPGAWEDEDDED